MMQVLTEQKVLEFAKSYFFSDGLIRRSTITYGRGVEKSTAVVDVSVRTAKEKKWINLHFRMEGLEGFQLRQPPHQTCEVLVDGVSVRWFGGLCYLDFSRDCAVRRSISDYVDAEFCFVGRRCLWDELPYSEK